MFTISPKPVATNKPQNKQIEMKIGESVWVGPVEPPQKRFFCVPFKRTEARQGLRLKARRRERTQFWVLSRAFPLILTSRNENSGFKSS